MSDETSLLGVQIAVLLLCSHMAFPLCSPRVRQTSGVSSSYKDTSAIGLRPHPFDLIYH